MVKQSAATMTRSKGKALPAKKPATKKTVARTSKSALPGSAQAEATGRVQAARLAQMVNLHIAGYSLAEIGDAIGATPAEVDRMLAQDVSRYVRSQPALRVFVRNFISEKYLGLLESVYPQATDTGNANQLDFQDRALRILNQMAKLHGAEMPVQSEIKMDAAPEMVQTMVEALAAKQGQGYDASIFDVVDAEVIEDAHEQSQAALLDSSEMVGEGDDDDF
jgi:hypothetical protein